MKIEPLQIPFKENIEEKHLCIKKGMPVLLHYQGQVEVMLAQLLGAI